MSPSLRIMLTGGGTGGHVYPALAAAARADAGTAFAYVGTATGLEKDIVAGTGYPFTPVEAGAVRGRSPLAAARSLLRTARGVAQSRAAIRHFQPDAVLATGGFVCVPVVLAARLSGVPSVVYLPDLRPGWAVKFLARVATAVAVSFAEVIPWIPSRRVVVTGYPVRPELLAWTRASARAHLGLPADEPLVLVFGGSQGARSINEALARDLTRLLESASVVHASGTANHAAMVAVREALPETLRDRYHLRPYLDVDLAPALNAADLVVERSGASTLGELPAVGLPGLLIPYPHAGAHQRLNADFLANRGAAVVLDDHAAREGALVPTILDLLGDPARLQKMAAAARSLAQADAARRLFEFVASVASSGAATTTRR